MTDIMLLSASEAQQQIAALSDVLQACVADGASVGFIDAADRQTIEQFWHSRLSALRSGDQQLLVARQAEQLVATVMVGYSAMPNGRHRAEISKLLVLPAARRQGIARRLMQQAEALAAQQGKTLLVLDTRSGDVATDLYLSLGWTIAGSIPHYAGSVQGELEATTLMYKRAE